MSLHTRVQTLRTIALKYRALLMGLVLVGGITAGWLAFHIDSPIPVLPKESATPDPAPNHANINKLSASVLPPTFTLPDKVDSELLQKRFLSNSILTQFPSPSIPPLPQLSSIEEMKKRIKPFERITGDQLIDRMLTQRIITPEQATRLKEMGKELPKLSE